MFWLNFLIGVDAHPFQEQFVGHRTEFQMSQDGIEATTKIEVPVAMLEQYFQDSSKANKKIWLEQWVNELQQDIRDHWLIELNGQRHSWTTAECIEPTLKEAARFLVFECTLETPIPQPLDTIQVLDQVLLGEPSVYWTSIELEGSINVVETDRIQWTNLDHTRYQSTLERWQMEDSAREVRMVIQLNHFITMCEHWWMTTVYGQSDTISLQSAFLPTDWMLSWHKGWIPWWVGLACVLIGFIGATSRAHSYRLAIVLPPVLYFLPVVSWRWRTGLLAGCLLVGLVNNKQRWFWWWLVLGILLQPIWWIILVWMCCKFGHYLVYDSKYSINKLN